MNRIKNDKLLKSYHKRVCCSCGHIGQVAGHHIKSKGAGGDDIDENLLPLCQHCHILVHNLGLKKFAEHRPGVKEALSIKDWSFCEHREKWVKYEWDN